MKNNLFIALGLLLMSGFGFSFEELDRVNSAFKAKISDETKAYEENLQRAGVKYMLQLQTMEGQLGSAGDLDGLLAVQKEKQRLSGIPSVSRNDIVNEPDALNKLQTAYLGYTDVQASTIAKTLMGLASAYMSKLGELETWLTKNNRIEDAVETSKLRKSMNIGADLMENSLFEDIPGRDKISAEIAQTAYRSTLARWKNHIRAKAIGQARNSVKPEIHLGDKQINSETKSYNGSLTIHEIRSDGTSGIGETLSLSSSSPSDADTRVLEALDEIDEGSILVLVTRGRPEVPKSVKSALRDFGADVGPKRTSEYAPYILIGVKGLTPGAAFELEGEPKSAEINYPVPPPVVQAAAPAAPNAIQGLMKRPERKSGFRRF